MISEATERFLRKHIRRHLRMGMKRTQAVAVAYHEARDKGMKVPNKP